MPSETRRYRFQTAWCTVRIIGYAMFRQRVGFGRVAVCVVRMEFPSVRNLMV